MTRPFQQLDLFGALLPAKGPPPAPSPPRRRAAAPRRRPGELEPIPPPDPTLVALASRLPAHVRLGTSSWTFPGWAGLVYRRSYPSERVFVKRSLEEYARFPLFRTVGIDRSFWSPIHEDELTAYAAQLPDGFRCVMKVWEEITTVSYASHPRWGIKAGQKNPNFLDPEVFCAAIAEPVMRAFGHRMGAFVLEIPPPPKLPDRRAFESALARFFERVPRDIHFAVELRDKRLLTKRHLDLLRAHGASHVMSQWSRMPSIREQLDLPGSMMGRMVVARLMLPVGGEYEAQRAAFTPFDRVVTPDAEMRDDVMRLAREAEDRGIELYVVVNNKVEGSSPWTVRALAQRLADGLAARRAGASVAEETR